MVVDGKIGDPHIVHIISRDPAPPPVGYIKVSGGLFLDQTIHDFDMARFLIDSEVEEIYATGGVMVDPAIGQAGDIDTAVITLRYKNGAIGTIDNSRQAVYGYDQRVEVFGSKGSVVVANPTPHTAIVSHAETVESAKPLYFFLERYMDAYAAEMRVFVDCILHDTSPPVTGIDGRIPVVMGLAAWKSYRENRPVKLSEIGDR
jgi:myo-inositol 2-dehydrogenase/D-chiro-inositol 1-dehydrogenase